MKFPFLDNWYRSKSDFMYNKLINDVFIRIQNAWYEEMINNRKKSTVVGMAWSSDGLKICIIYEDGNELLK